MNPDERLSSITQQFTNQTGSAPTLWARAPGRVDLMGSHTDYNQGYVMTMAIDRDTWLAARPRNDRRISIRSANLAGESTFELDAIEHDEQTPWANYVRGVVKVFQDEGYSVEGFDGLIHSTIPFSSGLSSSAALEVSTATLLDMMADDWQVGPVDTALLCQRAENEFVGVNSGILDQYSSAMGKAGHALLLDCRHLTSSNASVPEDVQIVICDTKATRELSGSEYGDRRAQCEEGVQILSEFYPEITALRDLSLEQFAVHEVDLPPIVAKRCRFIIEENQRVLDLAEALSADDRTAISELTAASYRGARDLYEIGAPAMEAMMQAMLSGPGVIGARQAGAGFGGCMVAFVERDRVEDFITQVKQTYQAATGLEPAVYPVQAANGAGALLGVGNEEREARSD